MFTQADDGWNVGESGIADALRDGKAGNGEASEKVSSKEAEIVFGKPLKDWYKVLNSFDDSTQ